MPLYAVKIEHRPWKEEVELPWPNFTAMIEAIYSNPPSDISPLCDFFRHECFGIRHKLCEISDVEATFTKSGLLELNIRYDMFDDRGEVRCRKMWVAL